jgi:hypothetical protein
MAYNAFKVFVNIFISPKLIRITYQEDMHG